MPANAGKRAFLKLAKHGAEALVPTKRNGRWGKAMISAKNRARLRKDAISNGLYGSFDPATGRGWDPAWDPVAKVVPFRPSKLTRRERTREDRFQAIQRKLEDVDRLIEEDRKERQKRKPVMGVEEIYRKIAGVRKFGPPS